jgi:glycosidase
VDGFRLDAAKHVSEDFLAYFSTHTRDYARRLGKKNFFIVGEVAAPADWEGRRLGKMFSDPANPSKHGQVPAGLTSRLVNISSVYLENDVAPYPGLSAVYDFRASGTCRGILLGERPSSDLRDYFQSDDYNTLAGQADYRMSWTLLEIHDWPRYIHDDSGDEAKVRVGACHLLTMAGTPIIYYGLEQGFNGNCGEVKNCGDSSSCDFIRSACGRNADSCFRQDMFYASPWRLRSAVPSVDALQYVGVWNPNDTKPTDPFLQTDHEVYKTVRKLTHLRRSCNALTDGAFYFRYVGTNRGDWFAYSRLTTSQEIIVVINPGLATATLTKLLIDAKVNYGAPGKVYKNALNGYQQGTVGYEGQSAFLYFNNLQVAPDTYMVFVAADQLAGYDANLDIQLCVR